MPYARALLIAARLRVRHGAPSTGRAVGLYDAASVAAAPIGTGPGRAPDSVDRRQPARALGAAARQIACCGTPPPPSIR